jgi:autotransporter passenger strand-loop-strand repeat protein
VATRSFPQIFGGEQDVFGIAGGGTVFGGSQVIEGGGTASNTTIANGGTLVVSAGGLADPTTILGGGLEIISARGSDRGALLSGGEQDVYGNAGGATIFADSQVIESGAAGATPLLRGGGTLDVLSGGSANSARISAGGTEAVSAGYGLRGTGFGRRAAGLRVCEQDDSVHRRATCRAGRHRERDNDLKRRNGDRQFRGHGERDHDLALATVSSGGVVELTGCLSASRITLLSGATLDVTSGYTLSSYALGKGIVSSE